MQQVAQLHGMQLALCCNARTQAVGGRAGRQQCHATSYLASIPCQTLPCHTFPCIPYHTLNFARILVTQHICPSRPMSLKHMPRLDIKRHWPSAKHTCASSTVHAALEPQMCDQGCTASSTRLCAKLRCINSANVSVPWGAMDKTCNHNTQQAAPAGAGRCEASCPPLGPCHVLIWLWGCVVAPQAAATLNQERCTLLWGCARNYTAAATSVTLPHTSGAGAVAPICRWMLLHVECRTIAAAQPRAAQLTAQPSQQPSPAALNPTLSNLA